ncbi:MAG: hypothetical protein JXA67_09950, partial [Micromonosporaceae bacterium]|nr:hypothetical protein [Micromonosporaceae bacterium]
GRQSPQIATIVPHRAPIHDHQTRCRGTSATARMRLYRAHHTQASALAFGPGWAGPGWGDSVRFTGRSVALT